MVHPIRLESILDREVIEAARYLLESLPRGRAIAAIAREFLQRRHSRICQLIGVELPVHRLAFLVAHALDNGGSFSIEAQPSRNVRAA